MSAYTGWSEAAVDSMVYLVAAFAVLCGLFMHAQWGWPGSVLLALLLGGNGLRLYRRAFPRTPGAPS